MHSTYETNLLTIQQQILSLEEEYRQSLQQGKEFNHLKEIKTQLNTLEKVFSQLLNPI